MRTCPSMKVCSSYFDFTFAYVYVMTAVFPHYCTDQKHGERAKESLRDKIAQYLERAEQLKKFLAKGKGKTHTSGGQAAKEKKK